MASSDEGKGGRGVTVVYRSVMGEKNKSVTGGMEE